MLIKKSNPNLSDIFMRNLFRRHPDMFMKSYASMEVKVNYLKRNLNRQLQKEPAFPLLLHYNFSRHIWPRCEVLRDFGVKNFDLVEALSSTDEAFCKKFNIKPHLLKQKKTERPFNEEKDQLWVYGTV